MTTLITGPVSIEDMLTVTATYDPTNRWNGFIAAPLVTRPEAEKIVAWLDPDDTCTLAFDGDVLVYTVDPGTDSENVERITPDTDGRYDVGLGWVWFDYDRESE